MKLTLITRRYPPLLGGAEKVLSYLAAALAEAGADVTVLTSQIPGTPVPDREEPQERLTIIRLPTASARFIGTWRYMTQLRRWLAAHRVDLAYVSMLKHDAYVAVGEGKRSGMPVVLRPEGAGATGDLAWQAWGRFGKRIGNRCRQADAVVAISPAIRRELLGAGYDPAQIVDLPNGVPVPQIPWTPRANWQEAPRAVYVGRLAPEKGLDTLIDSWALVRQELPRARLTLIGAGPERAGLEQQIEKRGMAGAIELPGAVANPEEILRSCDLFVLPSREEGMSIALLEAMALALPVVASAIPGNRGIVTEGVHGRLAPVNDPAGLARVILEQWNHFEQAHEMARSARQRVLDEFSIAAVARRHLELFERLISAAKPGRAGG